MATIAGMPHRWNRYTNRRDTKAIAASATGTKSWQRSSKAELVAAQPEASHRRLDRSFTEFGSNARV